jgi:hypothetical protein
MALLSFWGGDECRGLQSSRPQWALTPGSLMVPCEVPAGFNGAKMYTMIPNIMTTGVINILYHIIQTTQRLQKLSRVIQLPLICDQLRRDGRNSELPRHDPLDTT